jgi:hypothetical protein
MYSLPIKCLELSEVLAALLSAQAETCDAIVYFTNAVVLNISSAACLD